MNRRIPIALAASLAVAATASFAASCTDASSPPSVKPTPITSVPGHGSLAEDTSPKDLPRLLPAEAYIRTYLRLFGGLTPLAAQSEAQKGYKLFDTWGDYLQTLGFPDYVIDFPRLEQTNPVMLATFERIGIALCDRTAEVDLGPGAPPAAQRVLFTFDLPAEGDVDDEGFAARFDKLHRKLLSYPIAVAPPERAARFRELYRSTVEARQTTAGAPPKLSPRQAGWALVCQGLIRHPEFHFY